MNNKSLLYGFLSLATIGTITGLAMTNQSQAEVQIPGKNSPAQIQENRSGHNNHHLKQSGNAATPGMEMMNHHQGEQHFIQMMIHHYQMTEDMANLALDKAQRPEIQRFAQTVKTEQNRKIEQLKTWYKQWYGTEAPAVSQMRMHPGGNQDMPMNSGTGMHPGGNQDMPMNSGTGMHPGGNQNMPMNSGTGMHPGGNQNMPMHQGMNMMSMMNKMGNMNMMAVDLDTLKNAPDFDKAFMEQMIPHQKMAVMMAGMVLDSNRPEVRNLAQSILQEESAEIEQMRQWYQTWYQ
ncbi:DUF305 domain-containing protein [Coleofasciculus chthonoplastes]|uniref:DUF305 domain-containing protein n=1 Tax=Coleofasciculus chthonoplastes TaxID=64178 RepID=UPI0032F46075